MKWEYRLIDITTREGKLERELNALGKAGWEAVGITQTAASGGQFGVLLKRPQ